MTKDDDVDVNEAVNRSDLRNRSIWGHLVTAYPAGNKDKYDIH